MGNEVEPYGYDEPYDDYLKSTRTAAGGNPNLGRRVWEQGGSTVYPEAADTDIMAERGRQLVAYLRIPPELGGPQLSDGAEMRYVSFRKIAERGRASRD